MSKARYFHISNGLRGAYMPDNGAIIRADTRKELKRFLEWEARHMRDAGFTGASKRALATLAADAWRNAGIYDSVMPLKPEGSDSYCYGLFVSNASKADFEAESEFH